MRKELLEAAGNWHSLNDVILTATEDEIYKMMQAERKGLRRISILLRLYGRYNKLRSQRERIELLGAE